MYIRKKNLIRFTAIILVWSMVVTAGSSFPVFAGQTDMQIKTASSNEIWADDADRKLSGGLMPMELLDLGEIDEEYIFDTETDFYGLRQDESLYGSAQYNSEWDVYSTNYYYNQLDDAHKMIWDKLDKICLSYLTDSTKDVPFYTINDSLVPGTETVYYDCELSGMDRDEISADINNFTRIFRISNPQYYFLKATAIFGTKSTLSEGTRWIVGIGVYPSFVKGGERADCTEKVKESADLWIREAESECSSDSERLKYLHDKVAGKVTYNRDILDVNGAVVSSAENTAYSQSAYSVFCMDKTVCAGYSQALEMVLNGAGIDCIAVTSKNHEWNKVKINNNWYNVDCTWDDLDQLTQGIFYKYYGRSDAVYNDIEDVNYESHAIESFWSSYLPACVIDTNPYHSAMDNYTTPGSFPETGERTDSPGIYIEYAAAVNQYQVTMDSAQADARIYYTLDENTELSDAFHKNNLYTESFFIEEGKTITAIAVSSGKEDSLPAVCGWHALNLDGNGADYGITEGTGFYDRCAAVLPANGYRKQDYIFLEWNTEADGTGTGFQNQESIDTASEGWDDDVTLYAQWGRDDSNYSITYELNGGSNHAANPVSYRRSTETFAFYAPTRKGYVFNGWYQDCGLTQPITQIKYGSMGDITLYAKWSLLQYQISYHLNGGKNNSANPLSYDINKRVILQNPERKGYTFTGWYTDSGCKNNISEIKQGSTGIVNLYAKWTANKYTIVFKANGGKGKMSKMSCAYGKKYKLKTNKFTREGYKFVGWTTKKNGKGTVYKNKKQIKNLTEKSNGKVILYAKWKKI